MNPTILDYLDDTYLFSAVATVVEIGDTPRGKFVVLDRTIFYPKGGGQPFDVGYIKLQDDELLSVVTVAYDPTSQRVMHFISNEVLPKDIVGCEVTLFVEEERRISHAKAHTSGHIVSDVISQLAPELQGKIGAHDPKESLYVKFQGLLTSYLPEELLSIANQRVLEVLDSGSSVTFRTDGSGPEGKPCRMVQIGSFAESPCGGTHVRTVSEIKCLRITKIGVVKKENMTKVTYVFE